MPDCCNCINNGFCNDSRHIGCAYIYHFYNSYVPSYFPASLYIAPMPKGENEMDNVDKHLLICKELNKLYEKKNKDYGDSFHKTFEEEGFAMARIRLTDKVERFKNLSRTKGEVADESIRDTLIDLANYAIMTVMELDNLGGK